MTARTAAAAWSTPTPALLVDEKPGDLHALVVKAVHGGGHVGPGRRGEHRVAHHALARSWSAHRSVPSALMRDAFASTARWTVEATVPSCRQKIPQAHTRDSRPSTEDDTGIQQKNATPNPPTRQNPP
ncbi:hypothetical protein [Streptomyces sp. NPDC059761]|uniref:hypothetical protein n=1 Tax=Streptomyces sp. NPDC059761 TaxID=3346937 RepID=UPI00364A7B09